MAVKHEHPTGAAPAFRKARYYDGETVEWATECRQILREHGMVCGTVVYESRWRARWRVRYLIDVLTNLQLCPRWELREHVERRHGGYMWTLEYVKEQRDGEAGAGSSTDAG